MDAAAIYRKRAADLLELARKCDDGVLRSHLTDQAATYLRIAQAAEKNRARESPPPATGEGAQPVAQQQQQIQPKKS
jgi:hypothetical protein